MLELKLRGYVTPEDFEGGDGERIQKALDTAKSEDIAKVVLRGSYKSDIPITIPAGMHLVLEDAVLCADLQNKVVNNFSFVSDRIYIEGKNSKIVGNIGFCHTRHLVLENLKIDGNVELNVSCDFRIEHVDICGALTLGRGTQNAIIQYNKFTSVLMSGKDEGYDVPGRESIFKNIILRDSDIAGGVKLLASEDCGFLNVQIDGINAEKTGVILGEEGVSLPREQYKNLTFVDINAPEAVAFNNDYLHAYIK